MEAATTEDSCRQLQQLTEQKMVVEEDEEDEEAMRKAQLEKKWEGKSRALKFLFDGGRLFDAFLMEAAQLVGQSLLALPWIYGLMGFGWATFFLLFFSVVSMWTNHLVISMLTQFRHEIRESNGGDPRFHDPSYIATYHDVIGHFCGKGWSIFTLVIVIISLVGVSLAQLIATASNLFLLQDLNNYTISKRTLTCIVGVVFSLVIFLPTAREYRAFSALAVVATCYTGWFFTVAAVVQGPVDNVVHSHASSVEEFFLGFVAMIFNYGGLSATIEKADVMNNRSRYDYAYILAVIYSWTITLPTGIAPYHTFGSLCKSENNAFYLFPPSPARSAGIILMSLHELVAFGLYTSPLFNLLERRVNIYDQPLFPKRLALRLLIVGILLLFSVMLPFYGSINGFFAAFSTTFATYILPTVCYNIAFPSSVDMKKPPPKFILKLLSFRTIRWFNWIIAFVLCFCGVGLGGYSSIVSLIQDSSTFSIFPKCYDC